MGPLFNYGVSGLKEDRILEIKMGPTLNGDRDGLRGLKLLDVDRRGSQWNVVGRSNWRLSVTRTN